MRWDGRAGYLCLHDVVQTGCYNTKSASFPIHPPFWRKRKEHFTFF